MLLDVNNGQKDLKIQLSRNIFANVINFIINIIIGLLLTPYFINNLGLASYGLIPLATSITSYAGLFTQSLNISVSRYLTIDLQRQDFKNANIIFNTSLFGMLGVIFASIPVILILFNFIPDFFGVPLNLITDVKFLFLGIMGAFFLKTLSSIFGVSLFAYNRLDIQNIIDIINIIIQVGLIVLLFSQFSPNLSYIGLSYFMAALVSFFITYFFSKKINPHFKVDLTNLKLSLLKEIATMSNWIIISQVGTLLFLQIDLIVVNKLFGSVSGGEYAAILMWSTLLRTIAGVLSGVMAPIILIYYSKSQFEEIINISKRSVKFMSFAMALPIGILCGFAPQILSLWIGPQFAKLTPLMWVLVAHLIINLSVLPLFSISVSFNKVRIPGLVILFMGIGNLFLALTIPYITGWGYYGVALSGAIVLTLRNSLFTPWYTAKILKISKYAFASSMLSGVMFMVMIAGVIMILNRYLNISTLIPMAITSLIVTLIYLLIIWFLGLNESERNMIKSLI